MNARTRPKNKPPQGALPFRQNGGRRAGAGRKPNGEKAGCSHRPRALLGARFPAHVTMKVLRGLPRLRSRREYASLRAAFAAGCDRAGFRLTHYAVLNDHLHFLVEARDRATLSRGLQGLAIRIAKALNKLWQHRGTVFADRYHDRILKTPREVRNALVLRDIEAMPRPVTAARTWMLTIGWRRHGLLSVHDLPATG